MQQQRVKRCYSPFPSSDTIATRAVTNPILGKPTGNAVEICDEEINPVITTILEVKSMPTDPAGTSTSAIHSNMIFLPTVPKKYLLAPLVFLGFSVGESFSVLGMLVNIYSLSRLHSVHLPMALLIFCFLILNQVIIGILFPFTNS